MHQNSRPFTVTVILPDSGAYDDSHFRRWSLPVLHLYGPRSKLSDCETSRSFPRHAPCIENIGRPGGRS